MHFYFINVDFGCHACRNVTLNGVIQYRSEEEVRDPSRAELLSIIRPEAITCPACGSAGACEPFSIEFEGYIYDLSSPEPQDGVLQVEVKKSNGDIQLGMGADRQGFGMVDYINVISYALKQLRQAKEDTDQRGFIGYSFESKDDGEFYCKAMYSTKGLAPLPPGGRYIGFGEIKAGGSVGSWGFSFEELEEVLEDALHDLKKRRERVPTMKQDEKSKILQGAPFSGSLFNSWFYAESLDDAKQKGYPYSNACFDLDPNTVIACGTAHNESPRDFMDNNADNTFKVDRDKKPIQINGKTVYYAKRC